MDIKFLLRFLQQITDKEEMQCFIVGGVARDKILGTLIKSFNDIDVTTGSNTAYLAKEFAIHLHKYMPFSTKQAKDGHVAFYFSDLQLDFSSNFTSPNINKILYNKGIKHPSPFLKEAYSRDFTINTLLMSLDFKKIKDITKEAIKDIEDRRIRTCLSPETTFTDNAKRIIRVIYLAAKLDFNVDPDIIKWVSINQSYMSQVEQSYLSKHLDKALSYDADKTIYLLDKMNLWNHVPVTQALYPYLQRKNKREIINVTR